MTYDELVKILQKNYSNLDASEVKEHVAVQFNIEGEGEGALYVEFSESKADVQPYEYYDNDAILTTTAEMAVKLSERKTDLKTGYDNESIKVWGDLDKILRVDSQLKLKSDQKKETEPEKKADESEKPAAKAPAKKTTAKKSTRKTARK